MRLKHPRTRLVTAGAALATLTVSVPATYAALKGPPPAMAGPTAGRQSAPVIRATQDIRHGPPPGLARPRGGWPVIEGRFRVRADRGAPPGPPWRRALRHGPPRLDPLGHSLARHSPGWRQQVRCVDGQRRSPGPFRLDPAAAAHSRAALIAALQRAGAYAYRDRAVARGGDPLPAGVG